MARALVIQIVPRPEGDAASAMRARREAGAACGKSSSRGADEGGIACGFELGDEIDQGTLELDRIEATLGI